jgi:CheY-like chemotaxis protein
MSRKKVLLIDKEPGYASDLKKSIEYYGYDVATASSGETGVDVFASDPFINVIVMDIQFGDGIDGPQTAHRILKHRNVPIIFWTDENNPETISNIRHIIPRAYVIKKSEKNVLLSFIQMVQ